MAKHSDSKKRIAFPIHLSEDGSGVAIPSVIQILPSGEWDHSAYGKFTIGTREVSLFVANFNADLRNKIPITQGHDNGMSGGELPAVGWFTDLEDRGMNGLWGGVDWTQEGKDLLTSGAFKYFSAEIYMQYTDPETGAENECVLVGGALTNKPYFKELQPVMFSEDGNIKKFNQIDIMDLNTILAKKPEELSVEEKAYVNEHKAELSSEQTSAFASVIDEGEGETPEAKAEREAKELGDANEAKGLNRDGSAKELDASEKGKKVLSAAEFSELTRKANEGATALARIDASERKALVATMVFSKTNKDGKFGPKQSTALESFLKTLSESQRDQFKGLVSGMPAAGAFAELLSEVGDGGQEFSDDIKGIAAEVELAVKTKITASETAGKVLKYTEALKQVFMENPELHKRYNSAMENGE